MSSNFLLTKTGIALFIGYELGGGGEGRGPHVGCRLKFHYFVGCRLNFRCLSGVGKSQIIFLSLVGNFLLVLSVVSSIF